MEEYSVDEAYGEGCREEEAAPAAEPAGDGPPADGGVESAPAEAARMPDFSSWLPGGSIWLYAVPVILLLFLWLFYPVILVLICIILALWLFN